MEGDEENEYILRIFHNYSFILPSLFILILMIIIIDYNTNNEEYRTIFQNRYNIEEVHEKEGKMDRLEYGKDMDGTC